jgi:hypothetical protein
MAHYIIRRGTCKVCGKALRLSFDSRFEGDPAKLMALATCNSCYGAVAKYRKVEGVLRRVCLDLLKLQLAKITDDETLKPLVEALKRQCLFYGQAVQYFHKQAVIFSTAALPEIILQDPVRWWYHLRDYRQEVAYAYQTPSMNPFEKEVPPDEEQPEEMESFENATNEPLPELRSDSFTKRTAV